MASITAPSTPLPPSTPFPFIRRSFTLPSKKPIPLEASSRTSDASQAENLFNHGSGKIVSFTIPASVLQSTSSSGRGNHDLATEAIGILPWASSTERTLAAGPFSIYTVTGNVSFIDFNSGRLLHTIFPTSRSWCVDGETKFVLRIRPDSYYRIELPNSSPEDRKIAEDLKHVFAKVSQFELTPCPFKRCFTVEIPESPRSLAQRRPWKPRNQSISRSQHSLIQTDGIVERGRSAWTVDQIRSQPSLPISDKTALPIPNEVDGDQTSLMLKSLIRPIRFSETRAVTAPPQLAYQRPLAPDYTPESSAKDLDTVSVSSSTDSFHSFHSSTSPLPPSPPYSDSPPSQLEEFDLAINVVRSRLHKRDESELSVIAESFDFSGNTETVKWSDVADPSTPMLPHTPPLTDDAASQSSDDWSEALTSSPANLLHRRLKQSRQREPSPLPAPTNLYSPRRRVSGHHLTTAIIQKTCSILLGPPIQLVAFMLNIAAKIAKGAFRQHPTDYHATLSMPCTWEISDAENDHRDFWEEDDYGISLGVLPAPYPTTRRDEGQSWELD